jgi:hypothetical protein
MGKRMPIAGRRKRSELFPSRVRALLMHPEVWTQAPNGLSIELCRRNAGGATVWRQVVDFLKSYGLVAPRTSAYDVNVPKLIAAVRELERAERLP